MINLINLTTSEVKFKNPSVAILDTSFTLSMVRMAKQFLLSGEECSKSVFINLVLFLYVICF